MQNFSDDQALAPSPRSACLAAFRGGRGQVPVRRATGEVILHLDGNRVYQDSRVGDPPRRITHATRPIGLTSRNSFVMNALLDGCDLALFLVRNSRFEESGMLERRNTILLVILFLCLLAYLPQLSNAAPKEQETTQTGAREKTDKSRAAKSVVYTNEKYRFRFSLPESWRGYSTVATEWEGGDGSTYQAGEPMPRPEKGPLILIVHPLSTKSNPRQSIPIMIFTKAQWELVEADMLIVSAAPVGPSELGRNAKYVFALPPRYNYADIDGREEVGKIVQSHPLQTF
jgi:hypothetical protein